MSASNDNKDKPEVKVGDSLPDVSLYNGSPSSKEQLSELCANKKVVLVGVPGAFTPTCHNNHLPGFIGSLDKFKAKGVDLVICLTVNDPFVVKAWQQQLGVSADKLLVLSDAKGELTRALGLEFDLVDILGTKRCKRFALFADNCVVKVLGIEPDSSKVTVSGADDILAKI